MASVATDIKRLFLRGIKRDADAGPISLIDALTAVAMSHYDEIKEGRVIASTGLSGATVEFAFPRGINPTAIAGLASEMLDRYDAAVASLPTDPSPSDDDIYVAMMAEIVKIATVRPDFRTFAI